MQKLLKYIGLLLIFSTIVLFVTRCSKNTGNGGYNCNNSTPIIRAANNEKGVFTYSTKEAVFGISVVGGAEGNVFYIICNLPPKMPTLNDSVSFSGNIRSSAFQSSIGGQMFYELEPTNITDLNKQQ